MTQAFKSQSSGDRGREISEFEVSLIYKVSTGQPRLLLYGESMSQKTLIKKKKKE